MKKITIFIGLLLAGFILFKLFYQRPALKEEALPKGLTQSIAVKATQVKKEDLNLMLSYAGAIKAKEEVRVYSKVTGKLAEYLVREGEHIEKGQTIALVDRDETGLKYELAKVESPISGIVGETMLDKGAVVLPTSGIVPGTTLAIVVDMDKMTVKLDIPEVDVPYFKNGLKAKVQADAYPNEDFLGEVSKVSEVVDTATRTLPVEITISNDEHRLKSGMFARIKIYAAELKDRLVLPQDALIQELGQNYVFLVEDNTAKKKKVTLGVHDDGNVEITEGVSFGDKIIVFGQQGLKDGTPVELREE